MPSRTSTPGRAALSSQAVPPAAGDPAWPEVRLVAVPGGWPPYDCEAHGATCPAAAPAAAPVSQAGGRDGTGVAAAARAGAAAPGIDAPGTAAPGGAPLRGAGPGGAGAGGAGADGAAADGAAVPSLAAAWPGQFARVLVEILAGLRPARQLAPWTTERARAQVDQLSRAVDAGQRPRIRRIITSRPAAAVVEMTTVVGFGSRSRALAMRFEHVPARPAAPGRPARPARWLCTEIETGLPDVMTQRS